ncbi:hypothetical protein MNEG_0592 [Monoraphidium neglectum]|uniref:Coenzyme Q-binding protein COQ10 START domain-containing protein n=1 Tax=Monoraphidium neglectum TaxID=145388 RepID=A0A0D2NT28_9CHLO|nr:hypothetical protein MNEG_0592 [Monoraphidium neglectum]KIZ07366.1 hypothetical protein MNEG_0592 [Monoraphidium neglectum]|eukprot:XP_013906385.1 hypothetical protein MNEG_0592 [Monoraphidium neglectum]
MHRTGVCTYPNGSRYEGDWEEDQRSGWGRLDAADGQSYEGEWRGDKMHGQGKWCFAGDKGYYIGAYEAGQRTRGRLVRGQDHEYEYDGEGPFEHDMRHGSDGECSYAGGGRYVGDWRADARHGRGRMELSDGTTYEGEWRGDKRHGQGACRYSNGDRYAGSWAEGVRAGQGRCAFANGDKYAGAWAGDTMEGIGTMAYADGGRYHGDWKAGRRHGVGLMVFADGASFRGRWEEGTWLQSAADPARCRLRGRGLARAVAGEEAGFRLQARDEDDNPRLSGGDAFVVTLLRETPQAAPDAAMITSAASAALQAPPGAEGGGAGDEGAGGDGEQPAGAKAGRLEVVGAGRVRDCGDGRYEVAYRLEGAGRYLLAVTDGDGAHVADSPYPLRVLPGPPCAARCTAEGAGRRAAAAGERATFSVVARDAFGNACDGLSAAALAAALPLSMQLVAGGGGAGAVTAVESAPGDGGRWQCAFTAERAGLYVLEVMALAATGPAAPITAPAGERPGGSDGGGAGPGGAWRHVRGSPFGVRVSDACAGGAEARASAKQGAGVRDVVGWWGEVAAREYGAGDGDMTGFDNTGSGADPSAADSAPEAAFVAANPSVAVVERLEDLWLLSKLQRERKLQQRPGGNPQQQQQQQPVVAPAPPGSGVSPPRRAPSPAAATAVRVAEAAVAPLRDLQVEFMGVLNGMQTVRGVIEVDAHPDLVYKILTDYDRCSEVFENISASSTIEEDGAKQVIQVHGARACSWRFLAFAGSFNVHLSVSEDAAARSLVFRLVRSSFMRDFEGRWQVSPCGGGGGGARVEHVLAVKPTMPIPAAISQYTQGIFTRQVSNILRDLEREIIKQAAASN